MPGWDELCARLVETAGALAADPFPQDDRGRAEGSRHLARQLVIALQDELEHGDPRSPSFFRYEEPWTQWGGPNPDNVYLRAHVEPDSTYRVWGDVRGVRAAIFSVVEGDMHLEQYGVFAERTLDTFDVSDAGEFELWLSAHEHTGNWMPLEPGARLFMVRQYQCDWEQDAVATLHIERVTSAAEDADALGAPTTNEVEAALLRAANWTARSIHYWQAYADQARNRLPANVFSAPATPPGGAPSIGYGAAWWHLTDNQALIVTSEVPDADYWGWTIHNRHWFDSGDFANRQTSLNLAQMHVDPDGKFRLVLCAHDPGVPNWIDTEGRPEGLITYRYIGARAKPVPEGTVVPMSAIRDALPRDHPAVTHEQRRTALARRRAAALARYR